jgi:hypothetical protein
VYERRFLSGRAKNIKLSAPGEKFALGIISVVSGFLLYIKSVPP